MARTDDVHSMIEGLPLVEDNFERPARPRVVFKHQHAMHACSLLCSNHLLLVFWTPLSSPIVFVQVVEMDLYTKAVRGLCPPVPVVVDSLLCGQWSPMPSPLSVFLVPVV